MSANRERLRILFLDDVPTDIELAERAIRAGGVDFVSRRTDCREEFEQALDAFSPNIVISDYSMPAFDGMAALGIVRSRDDLKPVIILTGSMNEATAVECIKAGASDYVIKEHISRLPYAVLEAVDRHRLQVTAREQEEAIRQSELRYRVLFEDCHAVMLVIDPESGAIVEANQAAAAFYGWSREELLGMSIFRINTRDEASLRRDMTQALSSKNSHFEFQHKTADGGIRDVETHSGAISLNGRTLLFSVIHDISDRIAAERERDELASRLSHYLSTSPTVTYSLKISGGETRWLWVSENVRDLLGYSQGEVLEKDWWFLNLHAPDRSRAMGGVARLKELGANWQEYRFTRKDRRAVWIRDETKVVGVEGDGIEVVGTLTDISERKQIEAELSLKSQALESAANAILIADREGRVSWANSAFERLSGYTREDAIGLNILDPATSGVDRGMRETILSGKTWFGSVENLRKDGSSYTEETTVTPVLDEVKRVGAFISIKSDVTERERNRMMLEASVEEKSELLREIHHRVNNNMQLIISLLSLYLGRIDDPDLKKMIGDISMRLVSMASIHEEFYNSPDLTRIDFRAYLQQLVGSLRAEFPRYDGSLSVSSESASAFLRLEKALPAGLVATELLVNALRFAYPGDVRPGPIVVAIRREGDRFSLVVKDEGVGLGRAPAGSIDGLGFTLVRSLSAQLRGDFELRDRDRAGVEAALRFPAD